MELLVACVFAYWLFKHGPQLVAEAIAELEFARRGEMSPLAEARLKRLLDAGIDPAAGGPMRQYVGNAWRDLWLDLEHDRRQRRAARRVAEAAGKQTAGLFDRIRDHIDAAVTERANRWRERPESPPATPGPTMPDAAGRATAAAGAADPDNDPPLIHEPDPTHQPQTDTADTAQPGSGNPDPAATTAGPEPIRVPSTVGEPIRDTTPTPTAAPASEGEPMTAVVHVTGVVSGAAEARAIQRDIDNATAAYVAAIAAARRRIQHLGEATVGEVQQAVHSRVVAALASTAEAAAAAEAAAKGCASEVGPQLLGVARQFDRLNS
ncbi:hypothetical protein [Dactylosporangium salmoneum]|uniref:Uncharacterized protein n=1 Tax=Dactylosporangium salmoneum TaxID=53361 RepID=A0ABN3G9L3_9ACTN